ncbi:MAG: phosphoadenosine phosphosulfate reductase family protein [Euryarchaeota archaeon]|nr:phosphoadenosine phosphosulfate reductase family protein [Euryarchaeota archaeon]
MRPSYLGKNHLHWCDNCHTPVLGRVCSCGTATREVLITPPGDARPGFEMDIKHINHVYCKHFNTSLIPEGHIVILNKIPDKDRMEEVVMGGAVVCSIRYLPEERRWEVLPRVHATKFAKPDKKFVVVDSGAIESIRSGSSVLAPGLISIEDSVVAGDEVFIVDKCGECIGVGRAKIDAKTARTMERGSIVRTRKVKKSECFPGPATWDEAVVSNRDVLRNVEAEAINFVKNVAKDNLKLPMNVSYSGGKDSLATLLVVLRALGKVPLLFADTGLEFAETYENVDTVVKHYGLEIIKTGNGDNFRETFETEGPPAVDLRWCCKVCKLNPVKELITEKWGECLSFIGQRKYESLARMKSPRIWKNNQVRVQLSAAPIQHWTALHVFIYLFQEKAPYNVLYERRIDRIGCYMCPSSDIATFELIKEEYPELWAEWTEKLEWWRNQNNLPEKWIKNALWRKRGLDADDNSSYT